MTRYFRYWKFFIDAIRPSPYRVCCALLLIQSTVGSAQLSNEHNIKAAFIYNIIKFVEWPDEQRVLNGKIVICVYAKSYVYDSLTPISTKTVKQLPIVIRDIKNNDHTLESCNVIYFSKTKSKQQHTLLKNISSLPILSISDIDNFSLGDGMVELSTVSNSIRMRINLPATTRTGLKMSSKLLSVATVIADTEH